MAIDARGFDLTGISQLSGGLGRALLGGQRLQQAAGQEIQLQQAERGEKIRELLGRAAAGPTEQQRMLAEESFPGEDAAALAGPTKAQLEQQAMKIDPVIAKQTLKSIGLDSASKRAEASRFAAQAMSLPPMQRTQLINQRVQKLRAEGRDPKDTEQLLDMNEDQQQQALVGVQLLDLSTQQRFAAQAAGVQATTKAQLDKVKQDIAATKEKFDRASKLRGEIAKTSSDFNKQRDAWGRVRASAEDPSPAGDLALIFNFMKVLDPGSTVREGEFANAQNAGGVGERVQSLYNNVLEGTRLTPKQRADFVGRSKKLFSQAEKTNKKDVGKFISIGERFGVSKEDLLGVEKAPPPPPPGFVIEGQ